MRVDIYSVSVIIRTAINIIGIMFAWQFVLKPSFADGFRQRMFAARRDMFIFMAWKHIDNLHPAYTQLRNTMNSLIQHVERMNFVRMLLAYFLLRHAAESFDREIDTYIASIKDEAVRAKMKGYDLLVSREIRRYYLQTSPLSWAAFRSWKRLSYSIARAFGRKRPQGPGIIRSIEADAELSRGCPELAGA